MDTTIDWSKPMTVNDVDLAFPARGAEFTPDPVPEDIDLRQWERLADSFFFGFDTQPSMVPSAGVDPELAMRHLQVVLGTYATQHEVKMRGAAYLLSLWFQAAAWKSRSGDTVVVGDPEITARLISAPTNRTTRQSS